MIARKLGREPNWARQTYNLTMVYTVFVMLSCLARSDSMNITVCTLALYMLSNPNGVKENGFRALTIALMISFFYDIIYLLVKDSPQS